MPPLTTRQPRARPPGPTACCGGKRAPPPATPRQPTPRPPPLSAAPPYWPTGQRPTSTCRITGPWWPPSTWRSARSTLARSPPPPRPRAAASTPPNPPPSRAARCTPNLSPLAPWSAGTRRARGWRLPTSARRRPTGRSPPSTAASLPTAALTTTLARARTGPPCTPRPAPWRPASRPASASPRARAPARAARPTRSPAPTGRWMQCSSCGSRGER